MSCLVWWCEPSRSDKCVQRRSVSGGAGTAGATAGRTPTQNALVGRAGRLSSHRPTRHRQHCLVVSGRRCELDIILRWLRFNFWYRRTVLIIYQGCCHRSKMFNYSVASVSRAKQAAADNRRELIYGEITILSSVSTELGN